MNQDHVDMEIRYLGDLAKVKVESGDVLFLMSPIPMDRNTANILRDEFAKQFPNNKCIVLSDGLQIKILSVEEKSELLGDQAGAEGTGGGVFK